MRNENSNIGALPDEYKDAFLGAWNTELVLWFWYCLYTEDQILATFEFGDQIITRRNAEMKWLTKMAADSGYTVPYFIARIKTTLPKLYPSLKTLSAFKQNVETGKFTGMGSKKLTDLMWNFTSAYFSRRFLDFTNIDVVGGTPDFANDFTLRISPNNTGGSTDDPFNPAPAPPPTPPIDTTIPPVIPQGTETAGLSTTTIMIVAGIALLIGLFTKHGTRNAKHN